MEHQNLQIFDVYQHPEHGYRAVRRGFSWLAFLMPSVWAVRHGLGMLTLLLLAATTVVFDLAALSGYIANNPVSQIVIAGALLVLLGLKPGFSGHQWQARSLQADGFNKVDRVAASNERLAISAAAHGKKYSISYSVVNTLI